MTSQILTHYKILEKLAEGGMGEVYLAEDTKLERQVALKFLPKHLTANNEAKERFEREAKAAAALNHPNIVTVYEIGEHEGQVFIAMEYVAGRTLKEMISGPVGANNHSPLPINDILSIAVQIASGLAAAHANGIVHRDVKPQNILVDKDNHVKILDFGLAKLKGVSSLTKESSTLGTVHYMSPEQTMGKDVDQRTDIWSFGIILYEMLTGKLPFQGDYEQAVVYSIMNEEPAKLRSLRPEAPPKLERIVEHCLEKETDKRFQHANEVAADLNAIQHTGMKPAQQTDRRPKRAPWIGIGAVLLAVLILAYFFLPRKKAAAGEQSIAVLPFVDMSPQKDQEYFCDGITEELINRLSNVQSLRVPARTSTFFFKGKTENIQEIGSKLNVQTVLEGSVQKSGDRLRITAQLINIADGFHLWSKKYDRELKDVFSIQDEISSAIVNALQVKLSTHEKQRISEHPIDNVKAYECFLKAEREIMRFDEKSLDNALAYLMTAIDIMGDNAELYVGMASIYSQYVNIGIRQEDYLEKAREYARKAHTLRPDLASALSVLGSLAFYEDYPKNLHDNFRYCIEALTADPNEILALHNISQCYFEIGQPSKSYTYMERMERLDPLNTRRYIVRGYCYLYDCRFKPALEQFRLLFQADPTSPLAQTAYSQALAINGRPDEAFAIIDRIGKDSGNNVMARFSLLLKHALLKDKESSLRIITPDFRKTCWRDFEWSYWVADYLSLAGAGKEALDWLENAIHRGFINYPFMKCDPFLKNIHGEERFKKLMEQAMYEWEHFEVPE